MFNLKAKLMLATAVLFLGGVSAANAQLVDGTSIKVNVPSAFVLKDETFPAGTYTIERTSNTADAPSLLVMRGEDKTIIFDTIVSTSNEPAETTELVFDLVGGTNYLSAIVVRGETSRNEIARTKAESQKIAARNAEIIAITSTNF